MIKNTIELQNNTEALNIAGVNNRYIDILRQSFSCKINMRGNRIVVQGEPEEVERVVEIIDDMIALSRKGRMISEQELLYKIDNVKLGVSTSLARLEDEFIIVSRSRRQIKPKTENQAKYVEAMKNNHIVFAIGPAGTGKTYLAVALALRALREGQVKRIVLTRPAVEAGEKIGYLPGTILEKVNPYLRPLYDAIFDIENVDNFNTMISRGILEIAPLAFMRGRTLNNAFIILDEAQNTTHEQMKMFLTRLGVNSKAVITGDITQIDLPSPARSGLIEAVNILKGIKGIEIVYLDKTDVVRHKIVQRVIEAYEKYENKSEK